MKIIIALLCLAATTASGATYGERGRCDGPLKGWSSPKDHIPELASTAEISVGGSGVIFWNGMRITENEFRSFVKGVAKSDPPGFLIFSPRSDADCKTVKTLRLIMDKALPCSKGGCGEGAGWTRG